jgi:hypothetical protein
MMGHRVTLVAVVGVLLLASASAAQAPPTKFITPVKGEAAVEFLPPQPKWEGNILVTRLKVKNVSKAPIAGLKIDEFWYNQKGDPVTGSQTARAPKPVMPGEIVELTLRVPRNPDMKTNAYLFGHANGKVKPKRVTKFTETKDS